MTIRLSPEARNALRGAIKAHEKWTSAFRNKHGLSFASMTRDDYLRAADLLEIDVQKLVDETPRVARHLHSYAKAREAAKVFPDAEPVADEPNSRPPAADPEFQLLEALREYIDARINHILDNRS